VSRRSFTVGDEIRGAWGWFLALGSVLMLLGAICIIGSVTATFVTVIAIGWLLLLSGIITLVHAFGTRSWGGFFLSLLSALFRGFAGFVLVRYPIVGAETLTLVLASLFLVGGLFRAIAASTLQFARWRWSAVSGILSVVLGILLLAQMPESSIWFIGLAVGVDLLFDGAVLVSVAAAVHNWPHFTDRRVTDRRVAV
jgi:uncharacterized membrane protein HdeD (DUF308 family)